MPARLLVLAAAAVLAAPAVAEEAKGDAKEQAAPADRQAAAKEKKICRSNKMTGSLTRVRRICLTADEWRYVENETGQGFNDYVRRSSNVGLGGSS